MTWIACLIALFLLLAVVGRFYGPRAAVGSTALFSLTFPKWIEYELFDTRVDLRVASGIAALCFYCLHPKAVFRTKLVMIDWAMIAIIAINIASDCKNEGANWMIVAKAYGEWFVPYVLGRLAVNRWEDVDCLIKPAAVVCVLISLTAIIESYFELNVFESIFGARPIGIGKYMDRLGWRRAFGPTENPIYLGVLLLLLLPWTIQSAYVAIANRNYWSIWPFTVVINVGGILSTISRAPILSMGLLFLPPLVLLSKKSWRMPMAFVVVLGLGMVAVNSKAALELLQRAVGEASTSTSQKILLDGEKVDYSSTKHRLYLFQLYNTALSQAGFFGYGSDRTSTFPPNVPMGGKHDLDAVKQLWCIDNQFILITLRFGYLGLLSWCGVLVASFVAFLSLSTTRRTEKLVFYSLMAGALFTIPFIQFTVWMPHDYGFLLLWTCGIAAGAWSGKYQQTSINSHFRYKKVSE